MAKRDDTIVEKIKNLLERQPLAVLATQGNGQPYTSLMAFAFTEDLRFIVFATSLSTRKYKNIKGDSRIALLVDDRSNTGEDFQNASALTLLGEACEAGLEERDYYSGLYVKRHPSLESFLAAESTVFFKMNVQKYLLVSKFENVVEYQIKEEKAVPAQ
ncbi:pyridoxamine 5'-phosphate oxidase family protein [Desulforhopalus vacuolatus]|uniref:pyridoxamine 5'-phosphate oxidase family protein n=1 Tax=Desulforhopalus vacuolatus TaxID=40414 RepID=UPI001963B496|nr:pyridoxamine 5'-phosphate oxidase family protein [Desulforhopalus vacuolatus]MBM9520904.1 pyridoxamine 5'-phosphate oxidase family protein [Desulforhopalus vacuolatus]